MATQLQVDLAIVPRLQLYGVIPCGTRGYIYTGKRDEGSDVGQVRENFRTVEWLTDGVCLNLRLGMSRWSPLIRAWVNYRTASPGR